MWEPLRCPMWEPLQRRFPPPHRRPPSTPNQPTLLSHPIKIQLRPRIELIHHRGAMDINGLLTNPQLRRHLLRRPPSRQQEENLTLTRRQPVERIQIRRRPPGATLAKIGTQV